MASISTIKLEKYEYKGKSHNGQLLKGEIDAASLLQAKVILKKQGILQPTVWKKKKSLFSAKTKKIRSNDITFFTRQMATMLASGIPLVQAFEIVGKGCPHPALQDLISKMKAHVEEGHTLVEALKKYPEHFNHLYTSLVAAGEQSGLLDSVLDKLATQKEKMESIKSKIRKALFYPIAVILVAIIVCAILLIFVVPQFEQLFKGFGAELPLFTLMIIRLSQGVQNYGWLILMVAGLGVWGFMKAYKRSINLRHHIERLALKLPIVGNLLQKAAVARFTRTLATTFGAGVPLMDALKSVADATGNIVYSNATLQISNDVAQGQPLQLALKKTGKFPEMVIQMVAIGEESGELEKMLTKVANFFEEEVDNAVEGLSSLIEPLIIAVLGLMVGGLVIAMYLPIFQLGSVV